MELLLAHLMHADGSRGHKVSAKVEAICKRIVAVDCPGSTSANLRSLPYKNVNRPIFPLDDGVTADIVVDIKGDAGRP